jgi:hypothetical protein
MFLKSNSGQYIKWMALNSFTSSVSSVIATNSMLNSIMIKPSYTDVITTTYVGKDIIGQFGGLIYSLYTGKKADKEPEKYIKKGIFIQQSSFYLENFSVLIKSSELILPFLGFSSMLQNISFISIGAVNANNLLKLSNENIGELYCKIASINTLASTFGMIVGIGIINFVPSYTIRTVCILPILTTINYYSIVRALKIIK